MSANAARPAVTVAVICDFGAGQESAWSDMRAALHGVAAQDFNEPVEVLLIEAAGQVEAIPDDVKRIIPDLKVVTVRDASSYAMKNEAARAASADLLVLLDADCVPARDWLRRLVEGMRANPDAVVLSSKTEYAGRNLMERIQSLLSRGYLDPGRFGETIFISNNSAIFRRDAFLAHPLPLDVGPFGARMQSESFRREGWRMLFEPRTRVIHGYEGWSMEQDIRRNFGYGAVLVRRIDPRVPHAWLLQLGRASIPLFFVLRTADSWRHCLRIGPRYGVRWFQIPLAMGTAVIDHLMEIGGMLAAFRGDARPASSFR